MSGLPPHGGAAGQPWRHRALLALDIAVNIGAPYLIYGWVQPASGDVNGLLVAALPPILWSLGEFLIRRRVDALSLMVLAGIALSLLAFLGGGSARFLQLREKLVTLAIGLAFLISAALGKPLILPLARASMARRSPKDLARFDAVRDQAVLRRMMMVMTLVWGATLVAEFCLGAALIFMLPIRDFLIVGPALTYGTLGLLSLWTLVYRRRLTCRMRAAPA
ncbi:hypothetical protein U879_17225 [Defluviimonas sp. 20V17]|nr:hypothetical protein U879_17225 [Defluviimonas sp. 20V17]